MITIIESQVSKSPRCNGWLLKFTCPTDHADVVLLLFCLLMGSIQPHCTNWSFYYWHVRDPDSSTRCSNCRITANCADHRKYWWMSDVVLALDIRRFLPKVWDRSILQTYDIFHPNCDINVQAVLHFLPPQCNVMVSLLTYVCRLFNVCSWDLWRPCCLLYKLHQRDNLSAPQCNRFYDNICNCASLNSLSSVASIVLFSVLRGVEVTFFLHFCFVCDENAFHHRFRVLYIYSLSQDTSSNIQPCQRMQIYSLVKSLFGSMH